MTERVHILLQFVCSLCWRWILLDKNTIHIKYIQFHLSGNHISLKCTQIFPLLHSKNHFTHLSVLFNTRLYTFIYTQNLIFIRKTRSISVRWIIPSVSDRICIYQMFKLLSRFVWDDNLLRNSRNIHSIAPVFVSSLNICVPELSGARDNAICRRNYLCETLKCYRHEGTTHTSFTMWNEELYMYIEI